MFQGSNIFSREYNEHLLYRERVRGFVLEAKDKIKGSTLFGIPVDVNNPEDIIAVLYLMSRDLELYHEPR